MKIIKFGGTSLGTPERMKKVARLVEEENAIVVLSAVSGTTNSLTDIVHLLYKNEIESAKNEIQKLKLHYVEYVEKLLNSKLQLNKSNELINNHFNYIYSFTEDLFTIHEEKTILAQGELLSTALFQFYLEEIQVKSCLISALDFMRIDKDLEPDSFYIQHNLQRELKG